MNTAQDPLYVHREDVHNLNDPSIIVPMIMELLSPNSVLDVGCGLGTWLHVFDKMGTQDIIGVDGDYVDKSLLKIQLDKFHAQDLREEWSLNRQFDLVISLEVAEHLDQKYAEQFIKTLVSHGDVVVFSAAIPGQGGQNHLNEQWLSYWKRIFEKHDFFVSDPIRPKIWDDKRINFWYKQNVVIFCRRGSKLSTLLEKHTFSCLDLIHPDLFLFYRKQAQRAEQFDRGEAGVQLPLQSLFRALAKKLK